MSKIGINWDADLHPNKNLDTHEKYPYALVNQRITCGYPIKDITKDTIAKLVL